MAALFPKIYDIIDTNPQKHATLRCCLTTSTEGFSKEIWEQFYVQPLNPPGALSVFCMVTDPMYELGSPALKKQIQMETLLHLQERVDKELVGRRYPRKKVQDLLAGQISATSPITTPLLEEVLCELFHLQKLQINRRTKTLSFFPPDLRVWTSEKAIVISDEENTWSFLPSNSLPFGRWLTEKEEQGWKVSWPTADGKLDEVKAGLLQRNIVYDVKMKKDDLARLLGKAQALKLLSELNIQLNPVKLETS